MQAVAGAWEARCNRLPGNVVAVGAADYGHIDFEKQTKTAKEDHEDRIFYGDSRAMFVKANGASLAERIPATWVPLDEMIHWWGPEPRHPKMDARLPDGKPERAVFSRPSSTEKRATGRGSTRGYDAGSLVATTSPAA